MFASLDEADEMLNMGFMKNIKKFYPILKRKKILGCFCKTMALRGCYNRKKISCVNRKRITCRYEKFWCLNSTT